MPTVSIITCTYNRAHLIGETIQSILNQSFQDFEYIIVDDGSSDNTKEVVESFQDRRIKYFFHDRTGGQLSKLRNFAHTKCRGEYVAYVDSDDLWLPEKLERQIQFMSSNPEAGFSFTDIEIFSKDGIIKKQIYNVAGEFFGSVFKDMLQNRLVICHTTLVIRKICLDKIGLMDESMHSGDHDMVFFLSRFFKAFVVYEPLVRVRKHEQNSTSNLSLQRKLFEEHHYTLKKLLDQNLISKNKYCQAIALSSYSFGVQLIPVGNYALAAQYFSKNLRIRPWHLKGWVRWFLALAKQ